MNEIGSIQQLLDTYLREKREDKEATSWWASSAGGCMRKQQLKRLGVPPTSPPDSRTLRVWESGQIFHDWVEKLLTHEYGDQIYATELRVAYAAADLSGKLDVIGDLGRGAEIADLKTVSSQSFKYSAADLTKTSDPATAHHYVWQGQAYVWMVRNNHDLPPVNKGRIVLISKDDLRIAEFPFFWNEETWGTALTDYYNRLNEAWHSESLSLCTCPPWMFKYTSGRMAGKLRKRAFCEFSTPEAAAIDKCCLPDIDFAQAQRMVKA